MTEVQTELALLKQRADVMGITYHPSIGLPKLKTKVASILEQRSDTVIVEPVKVQPVATKESKQWEYPPPETIQQRHARLRKEASKLVRIRVTCMNPNKKSWPGEILSVSNAAIGTVKKFVPFNSEVGYHVPWIIYEQLKERQCQIIVTVTNPATGKKFKKGKLIKEFNIEVLDPLTATELKELEQRQALNHSID